MKTNKLGIYARQSREKETDNSIEDQIIQGKNKAKQLDIDYEIYIDRGESAIYDHFNNRPEFVRLLNDIQCGSISEVFVIDLSRLTRNEETNFLIKKTFKAYNIMIYTALDGTVDYTDPTSVLINDIKNIFAFKQVSDSAFKIKSVLRKRVAEGKAHGAAIKPYGYTSDKNKYLILDPEEADIVKQMYSMSSRGLGCKKIANVLNQQGVLTKTYKYRLNQKQSLSDGSLTKEKNLKGTKWAPNTILSILKNPIYKGERLHKGETFSSPKIIDKELWESVQLQIKKNTNSPGLSKHNYLLKGICKCGRCGSVFCGRTRLNKRDHIYYCSSRVKNQGKCGIRSINIDTIESIVWFMISDSDILIKRAKEELNKLKIPSHIEDLKSQRHTLQERIKKQTSYKMKILELLKKDLLTDKEAEEQLNELVDSIKIDINFLKELNLKLEAEDKLSQQINEVEVFIKQWSNFVFCDDFDLQYSVVRMFVEEVLIDFDDIEEIYTINIATNLPDSEQIHTFHLDSKGMIIDNKDKSKIPTANDKFKKSICDVIEIESDLPNNIPPLNLFPQKEHSDIRNGMVRRAKRSSGN